MPDTPRNYTISTDFPGGAVNTTKLQAEILASSITTVLNRIDTAGDTVSIVFNAALTGGEATTLDNDETGPAGGLIAAHDNVAQAGAVTEETTDPGVNDDTSQGQVVGSHWVNTSTDRLFALIDATAGAAVWVEVPKKQYDAVVAATDGDYTLPSAAFAAGHKSVFVRDGVYVENATNVLVPDGGILVGETQAVEIQFTTGQLTVDGNGGTTETAGTVSVTNSSTAVVGSGTTFTNLSVGDYIFVGPDAYEIDTITDATNLDLVIAWQGPARSGLPMFGTSMFSDIVLTNLMISGSTNALGGLCFRGVRNAHVEAVTVENCTHNVIIVDSANFVVDDLSSRNSTNDGLDITLSRSIQFAECHFYGNLGHGVDISGGLAFKFNDCEFSSNKLNGGNVMNVATDVVFDGCGMKQNDGKGVNTEPGTIRCIVDGCTIEFNGSDGIDFDGTQNVASACQIGNNGGNGVQCGPRVLVSGSHVHGNTLNGINLAGDDEALIVGTHIHNNTGNGVNIATSNRCHIVGCTVFSNTVGINIVAGSTDTFLSANFIHSNTTDIADAGTSTMWDVKVMGVTQTVLHNFGAATDPVAGDDVADGYTAGSVWVNTTASPRRIFFCVDNAAAAAVWQSLTDLEIDSATFNAEFDNGNSGTADTITWTVGNKQRSTLTGNVTYTFVAPAGPTNLMFRLIQDATGGRTATWPAAVLWPGGTAPTLSAAANAVDIVALYYDGTNYYSVASLNFS